MVFPSSVFQGMSRKSTNRTGGVTPDLAMIVWGTGVP